MPEGFSKKEEEEESPLSSSPNDLVIRDGFPALRLPGNNQGPWIEGEEPIPRHKFWAQANAFDFRQLESLQRDCETVFSARAKEDEHAYSAGVTYFMPSQMKPRCVLEALVHAIFRRHTEGLEDGVMIPEQSGGEWWTLVLDNEDDEKDTAVSGVHDDNEDEEDENDEVGLHFDADYGLEDQAPNLLLHPRIATVTYLSDCGAPTVVLDRKSPPPNDVEKRSLQGSIQRGWLSHPVVGKHIAFDGRLLHGAPASFFPALPSPTTADSLSEPPPSKKRKSSPQQRKRITLLVNVWVNHCPLDAELLDDDVCEQLVTPWETGSNETKGSVEPPFVLNDMDFPKLPHMKKVRLDPCTSDPAGEEETVICSRMVTVKYGASMDSFRAASALGDLVEVDLADDTVSVVVGGEVQHSDNDNENEDQVS